MRRALAWGEAVGATRRAADAGEAAAALATQDGPVILVAADVPQLAPVHAEMALEDLRAGCDISVGPSADGGLYLVAMRERRDGVPLDPHAWTGREVFASTLEAAFAASLEVGMLRAERALRSDADVRALLADPLAPPEVVDAFARQSGAG